MYNLFILIKNLYLSEINTYCAPLYSSFVDIYKREELGPLCDNLKHTFEEVENIQKFIDIKEEVPESIINLHKLMPKFKFLLTDFYSILDDWRIVQDTPYLHKSCLQIELCLKYVHNLILLTNTEFKEFSLSNNPVENKIYLDKFYKNELIAVRSLLLALKPSFSKDNPVLVIILSKGDVDADFLLSLKNINNYLNQDISMLNEKIRRLT